MKRFTEPKSVMLQVLARSIMGARPSSIVICTLLKLSKSALRTATPSDKIVMELPLRRHRIVP